MIHLLRKQSTRSLKAVILSCFLSWSEVWSGDMYFMQCCHKSNMKFSLNSSLVTKKSYDWICSAGGRKLNFRSWEKTHSKHRSTGAYNISVFRTHFFIWSLDKRSSRKTSKSFKKNTSNHKINYFKGSWYARPS